jgi:hypothetical protein
MATQAYNRFSSNSGPPGGTPPPTGSPQRLALDNLIRRELRVADPNDPQQVAQALLSRYKGDPRAVAMTQEALGLPFLQTVPVETRMAQAPTSSDAELQQAIDDVERDLRELTTNSLLKDITAELEGWGIAVRSAITEGSAAARFSLDPRQRDKAFGIRRQLGDYARMARLVGALTPTLSLTYRKFAQSLDEVTSVLMVLMGEALANVGFSGRHFLLQVPYSELQTRRDAAIYALRNLVGATQEAYGPNDWPRGLDAYRNLFRLLEVHGQGDLRALLVEAELARTMDELIQRAAHGRAEGLRALGATAKLDLQGFRRLIAVAQRSVSPESPPLTAFLEALQLFADAFDTGGGFRLLNISRPAIVFYGLYGVGGLTDTEQALVDLVMFRGRLAQQLDCLLQCECSEEQVTCQVMLDTVLYDLDRAIDLYALGVDEFSEPERRAAAYSVVVEKVSNKIEGCLSKLPGRSRTTLETILIGISSKLRPIVASNTEVEALRTFVRKSDWDLGLNPNFPGTFVFPQALDDFVPKDPSQKPPVDIIAFIIALQKELPKLNFSDPQQPRPPAFLDTTVKVISQELCIHKDAESRWENLVRTMAPDCRGIEGVFNRMEEMLNEAIAEVGGVCERFEPSLPPHFETTLDSIADDVDRIGNGRPSFSTLRQRT